MVQTTIAFYVFNTCKLTAKRTDSGALTLVEYFILFY